MKARKENTFRNNIVAANLFPHKLLGMAARLGMAVVKMVVVVILWAGYFILSASFSLQSAVSLLWLRWLLSSVLSFGYLPFNTIRLWQQTTLMQ